MDTAKSHRPARYGAAAHPSRRWNNLRGTRKRCWLSGRSRKHRDRSVLGGLGPCGCWLNNPSHRTVPVAVLGGQGPFGGFEVPSLLDTLIRR